MKVLLINGSPHQYGCTYTALKEVADSLNRNDVATDLSYRRSTDQRMCRLWKLFCNRQVRVRQ